jgi:hypothetical protein
MLTSSRASEWQQRGERRICEHLVSDSVERWHETATQKPNTRWIIQGTMHKGIAKEYLSAYSRALKTLADNIAVDDLKPGVESVSPEHRGTEQK